VRTGTTLRVLPTADECSGSSLVDRSDTACVAPDPSSVSGQDPEWPTAGAIDGSEMPLVKGEHVGRVMAFREDDGRRMGEAPLIATRPRRMTMSGDDRRRWANTVAGASMGG
jgi:hypothetical protein